jgi:hypothetical protein
MAQGDGGPRARATRSPSSPVPLLPPPRPARPASRPLAVPDSQSRGSISPPPSAKDKGRGHSRQPVVLLLPASLPRASFRRRARSPKNPTKTSRDPRPRTPAGSRLTQQPNNNSGQRPPARVTRPKFPRNPPHPPSAAEGSRDRRALPISQPRAVASPSPSHFPRQQLTKKDASAQISYPGGRRDRPHRASAFRAAPLPTPLT